MSFYKYLTRGLIVTLAALLLTPEINARELRLDRSISAGLRHQSWQKDLPHSLVYQILLEQLSCTLAKI
jgi:hypothetical protein